MGADMAKILGGPAVRIAGAVTSEGGLANPMELVAAVRELDRKNLTA